MPPAPNVGQRVHIKNREGDFVIKSVSQDGNSVNVVSELDPDLELSSILSTDLMLPEVEMQD